MSFLRQATLALRAGAAGSVASTAVLAAMALAEGRGPLRPVNATSHWLHGPGAARVRRPDLAHTVVGYATHHAATLFWASLLAWRLGGRRDPNTVVAASLATALIAAATDYGGPTPRRFTPGWEFVLSRPAMALAYGAMAAGMARGILRERG